MDKFEKEYFESLHQNATNFEDKQHEIAKERIKMFSAAVTRQLLTENQKFDLVIGPGNSGLFMTTITKLIYEALGLEIPEIINVPITRIFEDKKLAKLLFPSEKLTEKILTNVLFVDDEIMRGATAKTCFELLLKDQSSNYHFDATIIAENHFFEWHYQISQISVRFFAYARLIQWINGIMGHILPTELFNEIQRTYPEIETYNDALAIIIGGGLKKLKNKIPYYDFEIENELKNQIQDYDKRKEMLINEIKDLVDEGISGYKNEEIKFRF